MSVFLKWKEVTRDGSYYRQLASGHWVYAGLGDELFPPGEYGARLKTPCVWVRQGDKPWVKVTGESNLERVLERLNKVNEWAEVSTEEVKVTT